MISGDKKFLTGFGLVGVALIALHAVKEHRQTKTRIAEIHAETAKDMKAIHVSQGKIMGRLEGGKRYASIDELMSDFKFEMIVNRED